MLVLFREAMTGDVGVPNTDNVSISSSDDRGNSRAYTLEAVIRDDADVLVLFREAMKSKTGPNSFCNIVTEIDGQDTGNSRAYTLDRLNRVMLI